MSPEALLPEDLPSASVQAVLIMDLTESVRIMHEDQRDTIQRWKRLAEHVRNDVLPPFNGRLVESRGDSMILTFPKPDDAVQSAFAIKRFCGTLNEGMPLHRHFLLRTAIHVGEVFVSENEVLGDAINLAARLQSTVAGPGEIVISAEVHDYLTPSLDADIEDLGHINDLGLKDLDQLDTHMDDLGNVHLKHVDAPVRAYRIGPPGPRPVIDSGAANKLNLRPTIAVIPFTNRRRSPVGTIAHAVAGDEALIGEVMADDIIAALSPATMLNVVSRLSTTAFNGREATLEEIGAHLKADYVLSGWFYIHGKQVVLDLELAEVATRKIKWSPSAIKTDTEAVLSRIDGVSGHIAGEVVERIAQHELQRGQIHALPTLENYTLLINAIVRMHRGSPREFEGARQMLQTLTKRIPHVALPFAWLAKWHVLRFNRGLSPDVERESRIALDCTERAIDYDPACSLAFTMSGFVHTNMLKKFDVAETHYTQALQVNPNESLAWLLKGTLHAFKGEGAQAMAHSERALQLSPLDPLRYFYESLSATAAHVAGQYDRAIALARQSKRANRMHPSTMRAMTIAQVLSGRVEDARETVKELLVVEPNITVTSYLKNNPGGHFPIGQIWADALRQAGVPH